MQPATIVTGWFSTVESLGAFPATFLPQFLILSIREYHNHLMLIIALIYTHKCQQNQKLRMNMREKRSEKKNPKNFRTQKNDGKQGARIQGGKKTGHFICFYCVALHVKTLGHNHMVINT